MSLQSTLFVFLSYRSLLLNKMEVFLFSIKTAPSKKEEDLKAVKTSHIRGMFRTLIEVPCAEADLSARFDGDGQIVKSLKADDRDVSNGLIKKINQPSVQWHQLPSDLSPSADSNPNIKLTSLEVNSYTREKSLALRLQLPSTKTLYTQKVLTRSEVVNAFIQVEGNTQKATEDNSGTRLKYTYDEYINLINKSFSISSRRTDKRQVENGLKKTLRVYSATELTAERGSVQNSQTTSVLNYIADHNGGVVKSSIEKESRAEGNIGFWGSVNKRVTNHDEEGMKDILPNSFEHKGMRLS